MIISVNIERCGTMFFTRFVFLIATILLVSTSLGYSKVSFKESKLKNGVILQEFKRDYTQTVSIIVSVKGGVFNEDNKSNGTTSLMTRSWLRSSKLLDKAEFYGANIGAGVTHYSTDIVFSAPTDVMQDLMADYSDFILDPKIDKDIFKREKDFVIEEIKTNSDDPNTVASIRFAEVSNKGLPYAMQTSGTVKIVKGLSYDDILNSRKELMKNSEIVVTLVGNYNDKIVKELKEILSKIDSTGKYEYKYDASGLEFIDSKIEDNDTRIKQAKLYIAYKAPAVADKNYVATKVLTELLGGGMSSRYFTEIRKNLGFAYSVGAGYPSRICESRFIVMAGLEYKNIKKAIEKIDEIHLNLAKTVTDEEVEKAKNALLGSLLISSQTNSDIARNRSFYNVLLNSKDGYEKFLEEVKKINKKDILEAAKILQKDRVIYILKPSK